VREHSHLKALGARHSFDGIADSTVEQISLKHFDQIELDSKAKTVTVGAGVTYGQLAPYIDSRGFAVHNLASLPRSLWSGLAPQQRMALATRTAISQPLFGQWKSSPRAEMSGPSLAKN
jgi:hypothetical protein